jgi:hypothetical protein
MVIRTKLDEYELEIKIDDITKLESAYTTLLNACNEFRKIQEKHKLRVIVDSLKNAVTPYWAHRADGDRIIGIDDRAIGIMLSLLDIYPKTKLVKTIATETGYPPSSVSDYLNGVTGNRGSCFEKDAE